MKEVVVVDYGLGNILSVVRAFQNLGCEVIVATSPQELRGAKKIVLPGVGAFPVAARQLEKVGLKYSLQEASARCIPILGICLGMQLLLTTSYEHSRTSGLALIEGEVRRMDTIMMDDGESRLPEVGWRILLNPNDSSTSHPSTFADAFGKFFYFVHSYEVKPVDSTIVTGIYERSNQAVVASIRFKNILGVQFHPEKSGIPGLKFLQSFLLMNDKDDY